MKQAERDLDQLYVIARYCKRLDEALHRFDCSYERFVEDAVFQDSCSLCIIQIGEAVNRLSDGFVRAHPEIEWSRIYGMRCHLVHGYEMFDAEIVWDAIEKYIPVLSAFCDQQISLPEGRSSVG